MSVIGSLPRPIKKRKLYSEDEWLSSSEFHKIFSSQV